MRVQVTLFAAARERLGASSIAVELPPNATSGDLRVALAAQFPALAPLLPVSRIAVNANYARDDLPLPAAAEIALIPPVSGG